MVKNIFKLLRTPVIFSLAIFVICGLIYPITVTGIGGLIFPNKSGGSLIYRDGEAVGSALIGQDFTDERFMKGRPSAVNYNTYTAKEKASGDYTGVATGSQNLAPSNPKLAERVRADVETFLQSNPSVKKGEIPADLLTASGSGLDSDISPKSAMIQIPMLMKTTGLTEDILTGIIEKNTKKKVLNVFGEELVNVFLVNLDIADILKINSK